jgi:CMP-N-acetylneuraminic acid synthetase
MNNAVIDTVALLPLKANSERIPGKNFRNFAGKPLFRWILETLLDVSEIKLVVINTDAREILSSHGLNDGDMDGRVRIRDRKSSLCGDFVSMNLVLADDIEAVPAQTYLMTHTTNPLLSPVSISASLEKYRAAKSSDTADSLFTVNRYHSRFYREDGSAINHDPTNLVRTQDLEPWFEENSNLYIFSRESFSSTSARIGKCPIMFETPLVEAIDIDDWPQWNLAEAVALKKGIIYA